MTWAYLSLGRARLILFKAAIPESRSEGERSLSSQAMDTFYSKCAHNHLRPAAGKLSGKKREGTIHHPYAQRRFHFGQKRRSGLER